MGEIRWCVRRGDCISTGVFLGVAVLSLISAIWLPPLLVDASQRVVALRVALCSVVGASSLCAVIAAGRLVSGASVHVSPPPSAPPGRERMVGRSAP